MQICVMLGVALIMTACGEPKDILKVEKDSHIVLLGNNLASRMQNFGYFETEMQLRYPDSLLFIRNMGDGGNTPGFRPHSSRNTPWAFPGAEKFQDEYAHHSRSVGHFPTPDEWLTSLKADIIIAFFGYNESFEGPSRVASGIVYIYRSHFKSKIQWIECATISLGFSNRI